MGADPKGNGATVRDVVLPNEPHRDRDGADAGDAAPMTDWLDRYVKRSGPRRGSGV